MLTASVVIATAQTMTGTTVVTGDPFEMTNTLYLSIQCVWTGTPTGTFKVQACNDAVIISSSNWSDLGSSALTTNGSQPAGSASNLMFNNNATGVPWGWIRLVYTNASSSGTFGATMFTKGA